MTDARELLERIAVGPLAALDDDIFAVHQASDAHYDRMGWLYDAVCGTRAYNALVWNTTPSISRDFARRVIDSREDGPHVELGCGSLLFTADLYARDRGRPCFLIDPSIAMLRMARRRLRSRSGAVPRHVVLVRGDSARLPVSLAFAATVLSMHVVHVVADREGFIGQLAALARPGDATVGLTSLVLTGAWRDVLLHGLHRTGELAPPLSEAELLAMLDRHLPGTLEIERSGQLALVTAAYDRAH
ncbi:MAG TPA: methyltransferase domain-containing protein [Gemmatimonadaceae bacterium]|jgi:SAM-dependent methyltransferase|nr:methyltransferase domain-containing protein [Gemmatimonadaceae bacterium]